MATLWIRQYSHVTGAKAASVDGQSLSIGSGPAAMAMEPGTDLAVVTFSTTAPSAAFAAGTTFIAIIADAAFHYVVGANPTATTGALKVPADTLLFIGVSAGQKVAAVAAS